MTFLGWSFMVLDAGTVEMPYGWRSELLYPTRKAAREGARELGCGRVRIGGVWKKVIWR